MAHRIQVAVPTEKVGVYVGKHGENLNRLKAAYKVDIHIPKE